MSDSFDPSAFLVARGLAGVPASVEPMAGGYQNQVFRVRGTGFDWVVKRFRPSAEVTLFPNLPDAEALALERVAAWGAAPQPVAYVPDGVAGPVLVYEFYEGQYWASDVAEVARLLRVIAGIDADGFRHVPLVPRDILAQGDSFAAACPPSVRRRLQDARSRSVEMEPGPRTLIHTDFGPGNLIAGAHGLKAIDWQCPASGDAAEDLAAFLSPAFQILYGREPLTAGEEAAFLSAHGDGETIRRLHRLRPFFDWRMAAYCAMRQANLSASHPAASERYRLAALALLERLP
jgi:aminoglycoside phosphotransferase (APT) family kinase protein